MTEFRFSFFDKLIIFLHYRCDEADLDPQKHDNGVWDCIEDDTRRMMALKQNCVWKCNGKRQPKTKMECQLNNAKGWVEAAGYEEPDCSVPPEPCDSNRL